jgi:hypothetical protein
MLPLGKAVKEAPQKYGVSEGHRLGAAKENLTPWEES